MECSKTCVVIFTALVLSTAGFVLTLTGWFAPPMNSFVAGVRLAGPLTLLIGTIMLVFSCVLCAYVQGKCCHCCYMFSSTKQVLYDAEGGSHHSPLIDMNDLKIGQENIQELSPRVGANKKHSTKYKHVLENGGVTGKMALIKNSPVGARGERYDAPLPAPTSCPNTPTKQRLPVQMESTSCPSSPSLRSAYQMTHTTHEENKREATSHEEEEEEIWLPKKETTPPRRHIFIPIVPPIPPIRSDSQNKADYYNSSRITSRQKVRPLSDKELLKDKNYITTASKTHDQNKTSTSQKQQIKTTVGYNSQSQEPDGNTKSQPSAKLKQNALVSTKLNNHYAPNDSKLPPPTYQDVMHKKGVYDVTV